MTVLAPAAPGRLGEPADPPRYLTYLTALDDWIAGRRAELDELDAAAQASGSAAELTADIRLGLALWQATKTRYDAVLVAWDSGRVGPAEADRVSALVWGGLDALSMSLPEATRLSDALAGQLRQRLQLDPAGSEAPARLRTAFAQLERLRDQVALEPAEARPAAASKVANLEARLEAIAGKASRGGDVGGLLGPFEADAAVLERDLIVGGAERRRSSDAAGAAGRRRDELAAREASLRQLVDHVVATVPHPPRYAVPHVAALGPVPADDDGLRAYTERLGRVARALDVVQLAYTQALADDEAGRRRP